MIEPFLTGNLIRDSEKHRIEAREPRLSSWLRQDHTTRKLLAS